MADNNTKQENVIHTKIYFQYMIEITQHMNGNLRT